MIIAIIRVAADPVCMSRMIARGTTITTAAPRPCTKRSAISAPIEGASQQPSEASRNSETPK